MAGKGRGGARPNSGPKRKEGSVRWLREQRKEERKKCGVSKAAYGPSSHPEYCRRWNAANREKVKERRILRAYGLTPEAYTALIGRFNGRCWICGVAPNETLFVDHDHATSKVRGALCQSCNIALGMFRDSLDLISRAECYLRGAIDGMEDGYGW